jgi:hypothetical protein
MLLSDELRNVACALGTLVERRIQRDPMFTRKSRDKISGPTEPREFESVEVTFEGIECSHQFRIWNGEPCSMFVLVKHSSEIMDRFKVGEVLNEVIPTTPDAADDDTKSSRSSRKQGRFRGHACGGAGL